MLFSSVIKPILLPPFGLLLLVLGGLALQWRWRRLGWSLAAFGSIALLMLAMPITGGVLVALLERDLPRAPPPTALPEAVVILSAEARAMDTARTRFGPGPLTLERLIAGAGVARRSRLPVLVTGGQMQDGTPALAEVMALSLSESLNTPVRWRETRSRDTWQNAEFSAAMLREAGITRIYLVSHAWHLRRAIAAFARFGITATAVPVRMHAWPQGTLEDFVPSVSGWVNSGHALHEWIGIAYYALR